MSVKHSILAVLHDGDRYGYQLRAEFEERTGATWPLNIGQVYTTLSRLERDGLVVPSGQDAQNHVFYRITEAGRDELTVKLALAVTVAGVDVQRIVQSQRKHALAALQDYTRVKARLVEDELAAGLVLESMIFQCEAEIRWLDHVEARVLRRARSEGNSAQSKSTDNRSTDNRNSDSNRNPDNKRVGTKNTDTRSPADNPAEPPAAATKEGKI